MLGKIPSRLATKWQDNRYVSWDQILPSEGKLRAAYKITPPNWGVVEKRLGRGSYQEMFTLEVDILIDGATTTIRSRPIPRQQPMAIPT